jgi:predicted carbohydrate-binding protein with CBM5 and CBM33 domain
MNARRILVALVVGLTVGPLALIALPAGPASAHGWITSPASRQDQCYTHVVANCGDIQYEPQSVEGPKGARSCSGGSRFTVLDNDSMPWVVQQISSTTNFIWKFTALHRTTDWQYFVDGKLHQTVSGNNSPPPTSVTHTITGLPGGRHKILAIWNIADTANAFYVCVDVNVGAGGNPPPPPPPPPPGGCPPSWVAAAIYIGGMTVGWKGHGWSAKWWTQGEEPGTTGQWGVWEDLGAC